MNNYNILNAIIIQHRETILKKLPNDEEKLYKLYDNLTHTPIIQSDIDIIEYKLIRPNSIRDIEIKKECIKYKIDSLSIDIEPTEYNSYPDHNNKNFNNIINNKVEFNTVLTKSDKTCDDKFKLTPHQIFLKQFMSNNTPYNGMLLFHGTGTGKTCTAISIAENYTKLLKEDKKILVLLPGNIKSGWETTILNPSADSNQCTGLTYKSMIEDDRNPKEVRKIVSRNYEFSGYLRFSNAIELILKKRNGRKLINNIFSNRVIIIDEVQRIRSDDNDKQIIAILKIIIKNTTNLKLLLLSATPMYNQSDEIITLLNLLLLNDNRSQMIEKIFENGFLTKRGKEILINKSRGYISYVRGERKNLFPTRAYPKDILKKSEYPINNILGEPVDYQFRYLQIYPSYMKGYQKEVYDNKLKEITAENRPSLMLMEETSFSQICNMVYPVDDKKYGENAIKNFMDIKKTKNKIYKYKTKNLKKFGPIFDIDMIKSYSTKIKSILDSLIKDKSEGIIFIYSRFIHSGIIPLILALEQNGYQKYSNDEMLQTDTKSEPISYEGLPLSKYKNKNEFIRGKYIALTADQNISTNSIEEIKIATSDENMNGEKIKIIIGSEVASEGLDLKNIRSIHILDPWHHLNRVDQIIGRGIRFCSHKNLPKDKRNVTIYIHSIVNKTNKDSTDTLIYRTAEKKSIQIGEVESILKSVSIDCYNLKEINYNDDDIPFSKVCSYQSDCKYKCINDIKLTKLNYDTLDLQTFNPLLIQVAEYIYNIYVYNIALTINDIIDKLAKIIKIDKFIIFLTLEFMINEKYKLKHNNIDGYIIYNNNYYIFQPFNKIDITIPVLYRISNNKKHNYYHDLVRSKKTMKKYNTPELNDSVSIDSEPSLKKHKLIKLYNFDDKILYDYDIERLSFTQKASLIKETILKLPKLDKIDNYVFEHYRNNFIYKTNKYELDKSYSKDIIPIGFYLYSINSYVFFMFDELKQLYEVDEVTTDELNNILKDYSKTDEYNKKYSSHPSIWGYNYISPKKIVSAIDFKIVKWFELDKKKKMIVDGSLGYQCNSNSQFSNAEYTIDIIKTYFNEYYKPELEGKQFKVSKKYICILFELLLRDKEYKNDSIKTFYNYDISFLIDYKYI